MNDIMRGKEVRYIPKIIHMVWFGGNAYSKIVKLCLDSWKRIMPDYEIMIWNENNFDINCVPFVKEAYEARKWAFVSDYVRLYALYNYGGIYIDSDVELLKNLDELLLGEHVVTGYEDLLWIPAAIMASEPQNEWIGKLIDYYDDRHFVLTNGKYDQKPNTAIIRELSEEKCGFHMGDSFISVGNVRLYTTEVFQPFKKRQFDLTNDENLHRRYKFYDIKENTYAIHHCTGSWSDQEVLEAKIKGIIRMILPQCILERIRGIYYRFHKW